MRDEDVTTIGTNESNFTWHVIVTFDSGWPIMYVGLHLEFSDPRSAVRVASTED